MSGLSIRDILRDATDLVSAHRNALLTYLALGVALPYLLLGSEPIFAMRAILAIAIDPYTYRVWGSLTGPFYLIGILVILVVGSRMAALIALQSDLREGVVGEAMTGFVGGALHFAGYLVAIAMTTVVLFPLSLLVERLIRSGSLPLWAALLPTLLAMVTGVWLRSRLLLAAPLMARTGSINPLPAMAHSFRTTKPVALRLFGLIFALEALLIVPIGLMIWGHIATILRNPGGAPLEWVFTLGWPLLFGAWFLMLVIAPLAVSRALEARDVSETFA